MTNTEDFYALVPGAIGILLYNGKTTKPTEEQLSNIQNEISSSMFSSYLANYQFTKGGSQDMDPQTAFIKARQRAAEEAETLACLPTQMAFYVEIGQVESINKMIELENSEHFINWIDINLVNIIKQTI